MHRRSPDCSAPMLERALRSRRPPLNGDDTAGLFSRYIPSAYGVTSGAFSIFEAGEVMPDPLPAFRNSFQLPGFARS